jgi:hypothetical protein
LIIVLAALSSVSSSQEKLMDQFIGKRATLSYTQTINAEPDIVFPLLCPVREAEWAEGWRCKVISAQSGLAEKNGVYATQQVGQDDAIWLITQWDTTSHTIEFVYFIPGLRVTRLNISVRRQAAQRSCVNITYVHTGITEAGNRMIEKVFTDEHFAAEMKHWETSMNHYLKTGKRLENR